MRKADRGAGEKREEDVCVCRAQSTGVTVCEVMKAEWGKSVNSSSCMASTSLMPFGCTIFVQCSAVRCCTSTAVPALQL